MRRIRQFRTTRQIIQPIQTRLLRDRIHTPSSRFTLYGFLLLKLLANSPLTKLATADGPRSVSLRIEYSAMLAWMNSANWIVSPASPEKAIRLLRLSVRVLSSLDLRIVAPRMAALEAAMMTKSRPVRPRRTSLRRLLGFCCCGIGDLEDWAHIVVRWNGRW